MGGFLGPTGERHGLPLWWGRRENVPGTYDVDYTYPTTAEVDYFVG